jgi:hypothetical protein
MRDLLLLCLAVSTFALVACPPGNGNRPVITPSDDDSTEPSYPIPSPTPTPSVTPTPVPSPRPTPTAAMPFGRRCGGDPAALFPGATRVRTGSATLTVTNLLGAVGQYTGCEVIYMVTNGVEDCHAAYYVDGMLASGDDDGRIDTNWLLQFRVHEDTCGGAANYPRSYLISSPGYFGSPVSLMEFGIATWELVDPNVTGTLDRTGGEVTYELIQ